MRALRAAILILVIGAAAPFVRAEDRPLLFSPPEWLFGEVSYDTPITLSVEISSTGSETAQVTFKPGCGCLEAHPRSVSVSSGGKATVLLSFDPLQYNGPIELDYFVTTNVPGVEKGLYLVSGTVKGSGKPAGPGSAAGSSEGDVRLPFYYSAGCGSCERFLATDVPLLARRLGITIGIERRNVMDSPVFEEYSALLGELGAEPGELPALLVGRELLQGEKEIREGVEEAIATLLAAGLTGGGVPSGGSAGGAAVRELRLVPVAAAGLLDGVNPCAFTTLVFLVSALAVAGRGRREVLIIGGFFTLSVFASYFAIGLGAFSALRAASGFPVVSLLLKWILFAVLVVFAVLSVYDYAIIRRGDPTRILLQLPTALKQRIHASIRTGARSAAMVASAIVMGFLVSVFELACTGQVYFPTIAYLVRARAGASSYLFLLLYNLGFILPLLVVFALTFFGLTSKRLGEFMRRSMGGVKLGLAALFVALAVLTVAL